MDRKKILTIVILILIYLASTGISYALFSKSTKKESVVTSPIPSPKASGKLAFDESLPKTEPCPLNGKLYSKPQRQWWETHRPLGVMIENHKEARWQSGLSSADVIYEAVAEGGITRFLAIYYCNSVDPVGPVRSARTYFLDFISEYGNDPLYTHVGGANQPGPADALSQISDYGWTGYNDLNQFSIGFPTFWRDYDRLGHPAATEHTMYSATDKLWQFAKLERKLTNVDKDGISWEKGFIPYGFTDDAPAANRPKSQNIHLEFWETDSGYFVDWIYSPSDNLYKRNNGATVYIDRNNNQPLTAKNIVVLYMRELSANDGYENNVHLLYGTKGTGNAVVFKDGRQIKGTWRKDKRVAKTLIFDTEGLPIKFNRGTIWFEILPTNGVVNVK